MPSGGKIQKIKKLKDIYLKETISQIQNVKHSKRQLVFHLEKVKISKTQTNKTSVRAVLNEKKL